MAESVFSGVSPPAAKLKFFFELVCVNHDLLFLNIMKFKISENQELWQFSATFRVSNMHVVKIQHFCHLSETTLGDTKNDGFDFCFFDVNQAKKS